MCQLEAALRRLPPGAAFSGLTAAWLHGLKVRPCEPIEVLVPPGAGVSARAGLALRRSALSASEIVRARGFPATSVARSMLDICATHNLVEATVVADEALHTARITRRQLATWVAANPHRWGVQRLRRVVELAEPATESPMETRLRLLLVLGGLPRPCAQVKIHDGRGRVVGRVDLYYERQRLGIEYDGATHRDSLADDDWRQNALLEAGVRLLRFTARDVLGDPAPVIRLVRDMLATTSAGKTSLVSSASAISAGRSSKPSAT